MMLSKYMVAVPVAFASRVSVILLVALDEELLVSGPFTIFTASTALLSGFPLPSRFVFMYKMHVLAVCGCAGTGDIVDDADVVPAVLQIDEWAGVIEDAGVIDQHLDLGQAALECHQDLGG